MIPITKDDLKERGFGVIDSLDNDDSAYYKRFNGIDINVFIENQEVELELHWHTIPVPNCKTLEDLDDLIRLFS